MPSTKSPRSRPPRRLHSNRPTRTADARRAAIPPEGEEALPDYLALPDEPAPATAAEDFIERPAPSGTESASKVSDLEREMARLLGEITSKRDA